VGDIGLSLRELMTWLPIRTKSMNEVKHWLSFWHFCTWLTLVFTLSRRLIPV